MELAILDIIHIWKLEHIMKVTRCLLGRADLKEISLVCKFYVLPLQAEGDYENWEGTLTKLGGIVKI